MRALILLTVGHVLTACDEPAPQVQDALTSESQPKQRIEMSRVYPEVQSRSEESSFPNESEGADEIESLLQTDPTAAFELLVEKANQLTQAGDSGVFKFLAHYSGLHAEAELILQEQGQRWFETDPTALRDALGQLREEADTMSANALLRGLGRAVTSPGELLAWLSEVPEAGPALDALLERDLDDQTFSQLTDAHHSRVQNEGIYGALTPFTTTLASRQPEKIREFIETVPGGFRWGEMAESVMFTLGRQHPEIAAEWLDEDSSLSSFFRPDAEATENIAESLQKGGPDVSYEVEMLSINRRVHYDRAMAAYIRGLMESHPEDALENLQVIHDDELREELRQRIKEN